MFVGQSLTEFYDVVFIPPKPIKYKFYKCDSKFWVDDIKKLYYSGNKYGLVVISGHFYQISVIELIDDVCNIQSKYTNHIKLQKKQKKGGQSAQRIGRIRDENHHNYISIVLEKMETIFEEEHIDKFIIAGPSTKKEELVKRISEPEQILKVLTIDDFKKDKIQNLVIPIIKAYENRDDRVLVENLISNEQMFIYGKKEVKKALARKLLKTLVVCQSIIKTKNVDVDKLMLVCQSMGTTLKIIHNDSELIQYGGYAGESWFAI